MDAFEVDGVRYERGNGSRHVYVRQLFAVLDDGCYVGRTGFVTMGKLLSPYGVTIRLDCRSCCPTGDAHEVRWDLTVCEECWVKHESYGFYCSRHKKKGVPEDPFPPPKVESLV